MPLRELMPKRDWFQILTNIGVVAGLAILIYELNQSNAYMDAQMVDAFHDSKYIELEHMRVMAMLGIMGAKWWKPATEQAYIFAHPAGVEWWERRRHTAHKAIVEVIDNGITRGEHEGLCRIYGNTSNGNKSG